MLVVTRKQDESIMIGDDIVIQVIKTSHGYVKLGITAPDDMKIIRKEIADRDRGEDGESLPE